MQLSLTAIAIAKLNFIANDPTVKPYMGVAGPVEVDLAAFFQDDRNLVRFVNGKDNVVGAILFAYLTEGTYEVHWMLPRGIRGADAKRAALMVFDTLWRAGATLLCGKTPLENKAARYFNRALGAKLSGFGKDGQGRDCAIYTLQRPLKYGH